MGEVPSHKQLNGTRLNQIERQIYWSQLIIVLGQQNFTPNKRSTSAIQGRPIGMVSNTKKQNKAKVFMTVVDGLWSLNGVDGVYMSTMHNHACSQWFVVVNHD